MGNVYLASNELMHHGTKGMHWGVRKDSSAASGSTKKVSKRVTKKVNKEVAKQARKEQARNAKAEARKQDILGNPTKLYKHRKEFTEEELSTAIKGLKMEREIGQLSVDKVSLGGKYAKGALAGMTTAVAAYNTAQVVSKIVNKG